MQSLLIGISMSICLTGLLVNPSDAQSSYAILHNFGGTDDGFQPYYGGPALSGSALYGMTQGGGGEDSSGVLYRINTDGTGYLILHRFKDLPPTGDGTVPRGGLTLSGSTLYGCTPYGGTASIGGTVFKINTDGSGYQMLYTFPSEVPDQCHPYGAPVVSGDTIYGMTSSSDTSLKGEIFAMSTSGGPPLVLHQFAGKPDDGATPYGSLTLLGSRLYGMTYTGGHNGIDGGGSGYGVIFAIDTDGKNYEVLHHFAGYPDDGGHPYGSLTLVGSKLYGMTSNGGPTGGGVIFAMNLDGGGYQVICDLGSLTLGGPSGSLTLWGSKLYGMASMGGTGGGSGGIFRINPDGSGYQTLHIFMPSQGDGGQPLGDLTCAGSRLYGWTYANGSHNGGVFFSCQIPQPDAGMLLLLLLN
jgi:uncharacterized repeat protein (TIGR03803 family)